MASAEKIEEDKKRALSMALGQIEKQFGKGSVMKMGDQAVAAVPTVSTGSIGLEIGRAHV